MQTFKKCCVKSTSMAESITAATDTRMAYLKNTLQHSTFYLTRNHLLERTAESELAFCLKTSCYKW